MPVAYPLTAPDSIRVLDAARLLMSWVPTAVHAAAEAHDTPSRRLNSGPGLGLGTTDQLVPSSDKISVIVCEPPPGW